MLVGEIMHPDPVTVAPGATLQEAYDLLVRHGIRHLPVVAGGAVTGVVTDRDLRLATSHLLPEPYPVTARVDAVMTAPAVTADPEEPVEAAAARMRQEKIGCLPVLDGGALAGIVTGVDLLEVLLRLTGATQPSGRLEVRLPDTPGALARLAGLLAEAEVNIASILSHPDPGADRVRLVLRVTTIETRSLAETLCRAGVDVVWPPRARCR